MSKLYENDEIRKEAQSLVNAYVIHRANELAQIAMESPSIFDEGYDFQEAMIRHDYDSAAQYWLDSLSADDLADTCENEEMTKHELQEWVWEDPQQVCADYDLDPEFIEIYEFWIVDSWFANRLQERGECVADLLDFKIWGRSTTGQAISMDYLILSIAESNVKARG